MFLLIYRFYVLEVLVNFFGAIMAIKPFGSKVIHIVFGISPIKAEGSQIKSTKVSCLGTFTAA